jgi:peptidoglycan/xylan/chitin deacetylase (PgdA/CDA1 family)
MPGSLPTVPVLMYHEIAEPPESLSRLAVSPGAWAAQLACLHDEGYRTVTAAQLAAALAGRGQLPDRAVVLTFDDGYADFHGRAMPVLERYGFTATVFVTTGWVADEGPLPAGRRPGRMLCWGQIGEAAAEGIEIGAHSRWHPQLDQLPGRLLREELYASKARLEDRLGSAVPGMAYPFGYSSARVRQAVAELGHDYACAVSNARLSSESDRLALPRLTIRRSTTLAAFEHVVRGGSAGRIYLKDRALTKGWAMIRRTRAAVGGVSRGQ